MATDKTPLSTTDALLHAQICLLGRMAFHPEQLLEEVAPQRGAGNGKKQVQAYNLCDGTRTQADVAKATKYDSGNFSKAVSRWVEAGILFKIPKDGDTVLLHLYPLAESSLEERKREAK